MAGNRNATPAQPSVGAGSTRSESRGGLFSGNIDPNINANAAQQVAIDTAEAEAAARAAEAAATASAMSAATATREAGRATMEADRAAASAAEAEREAMLAEDWVEGPSHGGYTYMRAVRDDMGNLLGTWNGQTTPGTVEQYLATDVMNRGNFMIERQSVMIEATDDPTDTNNSQYWVTQAANGAFEAAEAEVELLDAIARAANINIDVTLLEAIVAYGRFLDIGEPLLTTEERGVLDTAGILPLSATISNAQFENAGEFPVAGVIYSARAYSNLAQREAARAESEADAAGTSATNASMAEAAARAAEAMAQAAVTAAQAARDAAMASATAAAQSATDAGTAETNAELAQAASETARDASRVAQQNAEIWAEGTDSQVSGLGGTHSSEQWATVANYWAGFGVTVDAMGAITVNDGPLDAEVPNAHSAAYWAEQARMHAASVANDEITVETGSTSQSDVRILEFNENYFSQDDMTMHTAVMNLSSENVFMRWNTDFNYTNGSSFVTFGGNLYKNIGPNGGQVTPGTDDTVWQVIDLTNADLSMIEREIMELQTSLGNPMQTASATGSAYQRILQLVTDLATANRSIGDNTNAIGTNRTNIATNTGNIATNTMNIATNTGNISTLQTDVTTNTDNITNLSANQITILSDIEDLQMEIVDIPTSGDTTVNHGALARVIGNNFNELYWRFGATVSGVRFSDFVGTNNSPRDNLAGYVRLSQAGGTGGTTVHYQTANGVTTNLTEVEYDLSGPSTSPQILLTGQPSSGSPTIDTIQLMEVWTDTIPMNAPELHAIRIGDTIFQVPQGSPTPTTMPTLMVSPDTPTVNLYQDPAMHTITFTGTVRNGTLPPAMNFDSNVTVSGVTVDANSLTRTGDDTFTFTVTINTQTEPAANHPLTVAVRNVVETDGGMFDIPPVSTSFRTVDARRAPTVASTPSPLRFPTTIARADIIMNQSPSVALRVPGMVSDGTAYDIASFTRAGGQPENFTNGMATYELVANDIPEPSNPDETIMFTYNFAATPANMQPTANLTSSVMVSRFNPWFLQAGATSNAMLTGDPMVSTDVIRNMAALTFTKAANQNIFLMTTGMLSQVRVGGSMFPQSAIQRGTETVNGVSFNKYQILRDDNLPAGDYTVEVVSVTT